MKYKVGNRVKIKSLDWYNENKNKYGRVPLIYSHGAKFNFLKEMSIFCGKEMTITEVDDYECKYYEMKEDSGDYHWTDEMIEGLVEEPVLSAPNITEGVFIHEKDMKWTTEYLLPNGYIFKDENGNVINATKIILEKKKKEYPKTLKECRRILDIDSGCLLVSYDLELWKDELLSSLQKLLIARDAYWKIAGEEMELGKPWEPDWEDEHQEKYIIGSWLGTIQCLEENFVSHPLTFPTEEMRDAFYENFKEEIENCKELL